MDFLVGLYCLVNLPNTDIYTVKLGDTPVKIVRKTNSVGKTLVHLHENETTALKAADLYVDLEGGTLISLKHSGKRNIVFHLKKVKYEFDPNRMFTDSGIKKSLTQFGHYSIAAHCQVNQLANLVKRLLPAAGKIIAVHNNKSYSMKDYLPTHSLAGDAKKLHHQARSSYRNFYFVTLNKEFARLSFNQFNVALQSRIAQNDGSLSYYLANRNYINIETSYGQLSTQLKMLYHA